ncbi:MAG TPA: DUF4287 domain-containing protein [Actinomycetota bacterium]|jgi:uncharacterized protein YndB with AHSA1/START domain|nr:DUF4287 domain-containing protein [Actinomycetota bacterium]
MTKQKSFKGRVRARMDKTSESYTAARRQLLAKAGAEPAAEAEPVTLAEPVTGAEPAAPPAGPVAMPPADAAGSKLPYSDEVVRANTGRVWDEWFALLDQWGAAARPHPEIARWLHEEHGVPGWWAQGVTVGYERARGLRAPGQRRGGQFEVSVSKTVAVPVDRLYEAFTDEGLRERWLPGAKLEVRTAQPGKSVRANWDDGSTRLVISFTARGDAKSQVALVHERVPDAEAAAELKAWWRGRVAVLKEVLEA